MTKTMTAMLPGDRSHARLKTSIIAALPTIGQIDHWLFLVMSHRVLRAQKVVHPRVELTFPIVQLVKLSAPPIAQVLTVATPAQGRKTGAR